MSHNDPVQRLKDERRRLAEAVERGDVADDDAEAITDVIDNLADVSEKNPSLSTKAAYMQSLRAFAEKTDVALADADPAALNDAFQTVADAEEWKESTESGYQSALRAFVAVHHGKDEKETIEMTTVRKEPSIDPRTVLTAKEFHAIRNSASRMRDRALIDLLGYTGQRLRVIQAMRVKDVDVEEGVYYLPDVEGLKGADKRGKKRPLLGARHAVQEWLQMHPTGDPDDILITAFEENTGGATPGSELSSTTIQRAVKRCADRAGVTDKPVNPHAFRHFFVTMAKKRYKMDDSTIKHLIGHGPGSRVMETTYAHLDDDAHITEARESMGIETDEDEALAPPVCPTCGVPLEPDAEECPTPTCREVFAPGAVDVSEAEEDVERTAGQAVLRGDEETVELASAFIDKAADMDDDEKDELRDLLS